MSNRLLGDWITAYQAYTFNTEPSRLFNTWTAISVLASAMGRRCWLNWVGGTPLFPNHFILLVGNAAGRKGTALRRGRPFIEGLDLSLAPARLTPESFLMRFEAAKKTAPAIPGYDCANITEFTVFSEEFVVFLGYQNQAFIQDLCDIYDCGKLFDYVTKKSTNSILEGVCLNIIGAITPKLMRSSLPKEVIGGGFTSRFILVYSPTKEKSVPDPRLTQTERQVGKALMEDLRRINAMQGEFQVTDAWFQKYKSWYLTQDTMPPFEDENFEHYIGRRQVHLQKLCMVMSASESDSMILDERHFDRALALLEETEKNMTYALSGMGRVSYAEALPRVIEHLRRYGKLYFDELLGKMQHEITPKELDDLLMGMVGTKSVKVELLNGRRLITYTPDRFRQHRQVQAGTASAMAAQPQTSPMPASSPSVGPQPVHDSCPVSSPSAPSDESGPKHHPSEQPCTQDSL